MLSDKATDFFENLKPLIDQTTDSGQYLFNLLRKIPSKSIYQNAQSRYARDGIVRLFILLKLLSVPSVHRAFSFHFSSLLPFGKDVLYKVRNCTRISWRSLLYRQARQCMESITTEPDIYKPWTLPCFMIDDTDLRKRGKCIEFVGRIFSHVTNRYDLGFKTLNLAYWSGKHLLHLDFSLHIEPGKEGNQGLTLKQQKARYSKKRKEHEPGSKRAQEAFTKKTDQVLRMLRRAISKGFNAYYLLADSWFFSGELARFATKHDLHLISRPKFNNWQYIYQGKKYILGNLVKKFNRASTKKKWSRQLSMHHITVPVLFQGIPVRVFFYKEKKRGSKWHALITTDRQIGAIQAYRVYQNRWAIEVSYKELKQHMGLGKCQSRDFDAQIADNTHCLMAYNYLSHIKAIEDHQTIGALFADISQKWLKPTLMKRFWDHFYAALKAIAELIDKEVEELLEIVKSKNDFFGQLNNCILPLRAET